MCVYAGMLIMHVRFKSGMTGGKKVAVRQEMQFKMQSRLAPESKKYSITDAVEVQSKS